LYIADIKPDEFLRFICSTQGGIVYLQIEIDLCRRVFLKCQKHIQIQQIG